VLSQLSTQTPIQLSIKLQYSVAEKDKELTKQLDELKKELLNLRVAKVTGGAPSNSTANEWHQDHD
jgi:Ribosomal L29 protein